MLQLQLMSKPSFKFSSEATSFGGREQTETAEEINGDRGSKTNMNLKEESQVIRKGAKKIGKDDGKQMHVRTKEDNNSAAQFNDATINCIKPVGC